MSADKSTDLERWRVDRAEFERWEDAERAAAAVDQDDDSTPVADNPLAQLLVYLADGYQTGTLQARAVAFLFVLRPDLLGGQTIEAIAAKGGFEPAQLSRAVRSLRETAPALDLVMRNVHTSRTRFLALAEMHAHRRVLALRDAEAMAKARRELAPERVKKQRDRARTYDERKRLRVARQVLALADPLLKAAAADMAAFDRKLRIPA